MRGASAIVIVVATACAAQAPPARGPCVAVGKPQVLAAVPEASGIVSAGGALWTLNDSSAPVLFRLGAAGEPTVVTVTGADVRDWEDLAAGPCEAGTCLYIADIGDNKESRDGITIYEVPVPPADRSSTMPAYPVRFRYPDNPHDAEALLVTGKIGTFIITKDASPRIYQVAAAQEPGEIGTLRLFRILDEKMRITGAAVSADERWVALRSNTTLLVYTLDDFAKQDNPTRVDLRMFKEPQGEGVAFGSGGDLFLVSEGGGGDAAGVLTRIHCDFIR